MSRIDYDRKLYDFTRTHIAQAMAEKVPDGYGYFCKIKYKGKEIKRIGATKDDAIRKALEAAKTL